MASLEQLSGNNGEQINNLKASLERAPNDEARRKIEEAIVALGGTIDRKEAVHPLATIFEEASKETRAVRHSDAAEKLKLGVPVLISDKRSIGFVTTDPSYKYIDNGNGSIEVTAVEVNGTWITKAGTEITIPETTTSEPEKIIPDSVESEINLTETVSAGANEVPIVTTSTETEIPAMPESVQPAAENEPPVAHEPNKIAILDNYKRRLAELENTKGVDPKTIEHIKDSINRLEHAHTSEELQYKSNEKLDQFYDDLEVAKGGKVQKLNFVSTSTTGSSLGYTPATAKENAIASPDLPPFDPTKHSVDIEDLTQNPNWNKNPESAAIANERKADIERKRQDALSNPVMDLETYARIHSLSLEQVERIRETKEYETLGNKQAAGNFAYIQEKLSAKDLLAAADNAPGKENTYGYRHDPFKSEEYYTDLAAKEAEKFKPLYDKINTEYDAQLAILDPHNVVPEEHARFAPPGSVSKPSTIENKLGKEQTQAALVVEARQKYLEAYEAGFKKKSSFTRGILNLTHATGILRKDKMLSKDAKTAKGKYEELKDTLEDNMRARLEKSKKTPEQIEKTMKRYRDLVTGLDQVEKESAILNKARTELFESTKNPEKQKNVMMRTLDWYKTVPAWQKKTVSWGVGLGIGFLTGGVGGVLGAASRIVGSTAGGYFAGFVGDKVWKSEQGMLDLEKKLREGKITPQEFEAKRVAARSSYQKRLDDLKLQYMSGALTPSQYQKRKEGYEMLNNRAESLKTVAVIGGSIAGGQMAKAGFVNLTTPTPTPEHQSMNFKVNWEDGKNPADVDLSGKVEEPVAPKLTPEPTTNAQESAPSKPAAETVTKPSSGAVTKPPAETTSAPVSAPIQKTAGPILVPYGQQPPVFSEAGLEDGMDKSFGPPDESLKNETIPAKEFGPQEFDPKSINQEDLDRMMQEEEHGTSSQPKTETIPANNELNLSQEDIDRMMDEEENGTTATPENGNLSQEDLDRMMQEEEFGTGNQPAVTPEQSSVPRPGPASYSLDKVDPNTMFGTEPVQPETAAPAAPAETVPEKTAITQPETTKTTTENSDWKTPTTPEGEKDNLLKQYFGKHDFILGDYVDAKLWTPDLQKMTLQNFTDPANTSLTQQQLIFRIDMMKLADDFNVPITPNKTVEELVDEVSTAISKPAAQPAQ